MTHDLDRRIEPLSRLIGDEQDHLMLLKLAEEVNNFLEEKRRNQRTDNAA